MKIKKLLSPILLAVLVFACGDGIGPQTELSEDMVPAFGKAKDDSQPPPTTFEWLRHSPTAPPLDTYQASFWVEKGKPNKVQVYYLESADAKNDGDELQKFLTLEVPNDGLWLGPDGAPIADGDSVLITVSLDPTDFTFDFEPAGLTFNPDSPAMLTVWYGQAENAKAISRLSVWYHDNSEAVYTTDSKIVKSKRQVHSDVYHFSGYGVAW